MDTAEKICDRIASNGQKDSKERIREIEEEMRKIDSALAYYDM